jgi:subfamily B ATP-binding cassette protein MsbA
MKLELSPYFVRLLRLHKPYRWRLVLAFIAMAVTAGTEPVVPYIFQVLLDKGFVGKPAFSLWLVPVAVIGIFVIRGASTFASSYLMTWVTTRILNEVRGQMFARMLDFPLAFYATNSVGKVIYACQRAGITKVSFITDPQH